jgi:predicted ATP-dependent endonuclease of OLD family
LGNKTNLTTQLIISTHSSHIAHECEFSCLRYFRRVPAQKNVNDVPTSTVVNLSEVFGKEGKTQRFVTRYLKTTHCDLFFADAAILVEGPAERMLIPYFIREHFNKLNQSYITVLEIGGSHAHRLRPLIQHLGLITLVITDLDAAKKNANSWQAIQPTREEGLITRNMVLRSWIPKKRKIDELLDLDKTSKIKVYDPFFSVCVSYQCPVNVELPENGDKKEALSNTFEDALVYENIELFRSINGSGLIKKFSEAIAEYSTTVELGKAMFEALKNGNKAKFALDLLYLQENKTLKIPTYIREGLTWLQDQLQRKQKEVWIPSEIPSTVEEGTHT